MPSLPYLTQTEIDFGALPRYEGTFIITDPAILANQLVHVFQSGDAPTGKSADENEMDQLAFAVSSPTAEQFVVNASGTRGPVSGRFKLLYMYTSSTQL